MGFFTDTTVCIGCKACEVACKEWNGVPDNPLQLSGKSYDNTLTLDADNWRHVAFIEQPIPAGAESIPGVPAAGSASSPDAAQTAADDFDITKIGTDGFAAQSPPDPAPGMRRLMSSDVCKHCTSAPCLEVCPTGSLFRTEFDTVVVQENICNGCGYCVSACPYGVINRREQDGRAWKCTLCYDRLRGGMEPACAKACPTSSINFGPLEEMQSMAADRLDEVVSAGVPGAQLYGDGPSEGMVGTGAVFLLLDEPEVYGLPPDPVSTTRDLPSMWGYAAAAAGALAGAVLATFAGERR
jgi:formate dehydrogenase iron-sulfur subunit